MRNAMEMHSKARLWHARTRSAAPPGSVFLFLLFCYQRSFLELFCEQSTHIQLNKKTNNNRPAAFYILIIVIPQCCSSSLHREFVLFGTLKVK
uniref:Uncharacterized protein n=1 Tax=Meleagris gallopavo TaxID=9103 RepID=A0A803XPW1_MELGA